jgi:hypothetical protein
MFVLFVSVCRVGGSAEANETWEEHPPWLGTWHINPQVEQILGLSQEGRVPRKKLQIGFFESRDAAIEVAGKELIDRVESRFSKLLGHRHQIIAAGRWTDEGEFVESLCFVTQIQGATFLWFGDPSVALNGAEVSYVRGVDPEHDLLVLDSQAPSLFKRRIPRTEQTAKIFESAGYQRKPPTAKK